MPKQTFTRSAHGLLSAAIHRKFWPVSSPSAQYRRPGGATCDPHPL